MNLHLIHSAHTNRLQCKSGGSGTKIKTYWYLKQAEDSEAEAASPVAEHRSVPARAPTVRYSRTLPMHLAPVTRVSLPEKRLLWNSGGLEEGHTVSVTSLLPEQERTVEQAQTEGTAGRRAGVEAGSSAFLSAHPRSVPFRFSQRLPLSSPSICVYTMGTREAHFKATLKAFSR